MPCICVPTFHMSCQYFFSWFFSLNFLFLLWVLVLVVCFDKFSLDSPDQFRTNYVFTAGIETVLLLIFLAECWDSRRCNLLQLFFVFWLLQHCCWMSSRSVGLALTKFSYLPLYFGLLCTSISIQKVARKLSKMIFATFDLMQVHISAQCNPRSLIWNDIAGFVFHCSTIK